MTTVVGSWLLLLSLTSGSMTDTMQHVQCNGYILSSCLQHEQASERSKIGGKMIIYSPDFLSLSTAQELSVLSGYFSRATDRASVSFSNAKPPPLHRRRSTSETHRSLIVLLCEEDELPVVLVDALIVGNRILSIGSIASYRRMPSQSIEQDHCSQCNQVAPLLACDDVDAPRDSKGAKPR